MASTLKDEKFTPPKYIDLVRKVIGQITLDPASSRLADKLIKADCFFTKEDSGLIKDWFGNVFCNPPYSRGNLLAFAKKMDYEFKQGNFKNGIFLSPNSTDSGWFSILADYPICLTGHRISFVSFDSKTNRYILEKNPENGSCFTLFTHDPFVEERFVEEFSKIGHVFYKVKRKES